VNIIVRIILETNCDRLTSDDRFFSNLFRLLVTIEQSSLTNEEKFDALALVKTLENHIHFALDLFCFVSRHYDRH
jgi:hypothetical protein